jgi:signal transduction histidine kinase
MKVQASWSTFQRARLKLTAWYMLMFAVMIAVFTYLTLDAKNSTYVRVYQVVKSGTPNGSPQVQEFSDRFEEFNKRFKERLIIFDAGLLLVSGYLSYFLSGKTLKPIRRMVEEQQAFASDVSHSLRTPLTTINLELEGYLRAHPKMTLELKGVLLSVQEEIFSMSALVSGMLTLVRSETDAFKAGFKPVKLDDVLTVVVGKMKPLAECKNQELVISKIQPVTIMGNGDSLRQIIYILLENAIKYSGPKSRIELSVFKQKQMVKIIVNDNGKGIPHHDLPHIFDRYYRGKQKTHGTGLGLAIAQKLVVQHDGNIKVRSKAGEGTTFTVNLPITTDS